MTLLTLSPPFTSQLPVLHLFAQNALHVQKFHHMDVKFSLACGLSKFYKQEAPVLHYITKLFKCECTQLHRAEKMFYHPILCHYNGSLGQLAAEIWSDI